MKKFNILILCLISQVIYAKEVTSKELKTEGIKFYSVIRYKYSMPKLAIESSGVKNNYDLDTDYILSVAFGIMKPFEILNINVELESDLFIGGRFGLKDMPSPVTEFEAQRYSIFLNGSVDFKISRAKFLLPYLEVGLGFANHDGAYDALGVSPLSEAATMGNTFGWQVGGGLRFLVKKPRGVTIGYRYFNYGKSQGLTSTSTYSASEILVALETRF